MNAIHAEHSEALNDHGQWAEAERIRNANLQSDPCAMWNLLTAAEKRAAEPDAGKEIRGKRDADPLEVIAELRAELDDARQQHREDEIRIRMLEEHVGDLRAQLDEANACWPAPLEDDDDSAARAYDALNIEPAA